MLTYNYTTSKNEQKQIVIKLLGTPFVNKWIEYLDRISGKCPNVNWYIAALNDSSHKRTPPDNVYDLIKIRDCFNYINRNGLDNFADEITAVERLMAFPDRVEQKHLNKWHRMFTSLEMKYLKQEHPIPPHIDKTEMWKNIQDINTYTHHMETWTYHRMERRKDFLNTKQYSIQFTNANNLSYLNKENQIFGEKNIEWIDDSCVFDFARDSYHHSVWLHEDITGKDQMKAWLDNDDLSEFDITGNLLMTPSITLDPDFLYAKIIDNPNFKWDSKQSKKTLNRYPLGDIINPQNIDWPEFFKSKIDSILLDGRKLWPKEFI